MNFENVKLINKLRITFEKNLNIKDKFSMEKYLQNNFLFFGIKRPVLNQITKEFLKSTKKYTKEQLKELIVLMINQNEREWIYLVQNILNKNLLIFNKQNDFYFIKNLILIKPWWESVDIYSGTILSKMFMNYNDEKFKNLFLLELNNDENFWLKRASLLCQLKFKNKTNFNLLIELIENVNEINIFWIQKAIGWSLREYSKYNKNLVKNYLNLNKNKLSFLAFKEANKFIKIN